jgi:penicillin-binding protein 2
VTSIDKKHFKPMSLFDVYNLGTQHTACRRYRYIAGKTGTAENFAKIDGKEDQLKDHSIFVAFAPKDNPKIAIAFWWKMEVWSNDGPIASEKP